jgi:UDP-N-acetylglucosamine transferase subunit ALG13
MIFLTIGSHEPFDRLVQAFDSWCAEHPEIEAFAQIACVGESGYRPQHCTWVEKLGPAEYGARFADAALVVSHAGMGSIITAMDLGKSLVVMPRRGHFQETRNDHQWATAKRFGDKAGIFVAEDGHRLAATIDRALASNKGQRSAVSAYADTSLTDAIRAVIMR